VNGTPGRDVESRFAFVHVMKTAGTTLVGHLVREFGRDAIYPNRELDRRFPGDVDSYMNIERLLALPPARRNSLRMYTGHFPYMVYELIDQELKIVTMLRDPIERTISILRQFQRQEPYRNLSIEEIYADEKVFAYFVNNHQTKIFSLVPADQPRAILKPLVIDETRFALAKKNLESVDVVGVTEHFGVFVRDLQRRFGWWPEGVDLGKRVNVSSESTIVDPVFRRRIADDNTYDVELYEFAKKIATRAEPEA
jgi:hypothetical protein